MAKSPGAETPLADLTDLTDAPSGLIVYVYLLAPDVLLHNLGVLNHILADAELLLDNRLLGDHDFFFGDGDADLVIADLGLLGFALQRNPLHRDLFVPGGYCHALALGPNVFLDPHLAGFALAGTGR
jgi:hypothetical protein